MADTTMVNFRMDSNLKKSMESVCKDMGFDHEHGIYHVCRKGEP